MIQNAQRFHIDLSHFNPLSAVSSIPPCAMSTLRCNKASIIGILGRYKSVAYPAVSTTLPEGYGMGFVPWFCSFYSQKSLSIQKYCPKVEVYKNTGI